MTKRGTFKQAVRRYAQSSGKRYTEALAEFTRDEIESRVFATKEWRGRDALPTFIEGQFGIAVSSLTQLSLHSGGVFRVDRSDGPPWVARVFPERSRSLNRLQGDAAILRFLEQSGFRAERCATHEPVCSYDGQSLMVTEFVPGSPAGTDPRTLHGLADMLGRLHALPIDRYAAPRDGGAFGHDPLHRGKPRSDLTAAMTFLMSIEQKVPPSSRQLFESLVEDVHSADGCDDLPHALTRAGMAGRNVIVTPDGQPVAVDWKGAGIGPRLPSFAELVLQAVDKPDVMRAARRPRGDRESLRAIIDGYTTHVRPTSEEIDRLASAIRIYTLYFGCWYFWREVATGGSPDGSEGWWPDHAMADALAERVQTLLSALKDSEEKA